MHQAQKVLGGHPNNIEAQEKEGQAMREYKHWTKVEYSVIHLKSRIRWLQMGDENSQYFHQVLRQRTSRNRIDSLIDDAQGVTLYEPEVVERLIVGFFY